MERLQKCWLDLKIQKKNDKEYNGINTQKEDRHDIKNYRPFIAVSSRHILYIILCHSYVIFL